jgi:hypothetical protein
MAEYQEIPDESELNLICPLRMIKASVSTVYIMNKKEEFECIGKDCMLFDDYWDSCKLGSDG